MANNFLKLLTIGITLTMVFFNGCSTSPLTTSDSYTDEVTVDSTGKFGVTVDEIETYFRERVPDARFINCQLSEDSEYSLDFVLSDDKSEWISNYSKFALSIKNAYESLSEKCSVKVQSFYIVFFAGGNSSISWISSNGGEWGIYYDDTIGTAKKTRVTFSELTRLNALIDSEELMGLQNLYEDKNVSLYYYGFEKNANNQIQVIFAIKNKCYETLEFQSKGLSVNGVDYDDIVMSDPVKANSAQYIEASIDSEIADIQAIKSIGAKIRYFDNKIPSETKGDFDTGIIEITK